MTDADRFLEELHALRSAGLAELAAAGRGDEETARLYREDIQPDEEAHATVTRTLALAAEPRARAAERLGTRSIPGC